jgi:hypothetical protein
VKFDTKKPNKVDKYICTCRRRSERHLAKLAAIDQVVTHSSWKDLLQLKEKRGPVFQPFGCKLGSTSMLHRSLCCNEKENLTSGNKRQTYKILQEDESVFTVSGKEIKVGRILACHFGNRLAS